MDKNLKAVYTTLLSVGKSGEVSIQVSKREDGIYFYRKRHPEYPGWGRWEYRKGGINSFTEKEKEHILMEDYPLEKFSPRLPQYSLEELDDEIIDRAREDFPDYVKNIYRDDLIPIEKEYTGEPFIVELPHGFIVRNGLIYSHKNIPSSQWTKEDWKAFSRVMAIRAEYMTSKFVNRKDLEHGVIWLKTKIADKSHKNRKDRINAKIILDELQRLSIETVLTHKEKIQ